ncbi:hypothetical protein KEJ39_09185 [Candidatus Bathyarchaeota archaeon]|nr:hypothetical protein [Candidatus Bathyarchaeota archaeon]
MPNKALTLLLLLLICSIPKDTSADSSDVGVELTARRVSDLRVKVVFMGFNPELVNTSYLRWNLPSLKIQQCLNPGQATGVQYRLNYDLVFAPRDVEDLFVDYLDSLVKIEISRNPFFGVNLTNAFYPAGLVENWLKFHESELGGDPKPGYTLVLANLTGRIPSVTPSQYDDYLNRSISKITPHYYNVTCFDIDLHMTLKRRWMTSWGGVERLYYIDLSAGPSNVTRQLPLQWVIRANNISLQDAYGSRWLTQYLADYIYGPVDSLFAPDFIYPIRLAKRYLIDILVIDNRTDYHIPQLENALNPARIRIELEKLLPFAEVSVKTRFINVTSSAELTRLVVTSTTPIGKANVSIVDSRPLYHWFNEEGEGHLKDFFNASGDDAGVHIPVIAFIFSGEYQLGFTFKEELVLPTPSGSIWGVALGDMVLVSHSSRDLIRGNFTEEKQPQRGFGLTNTILHEVGHMLGLSHPFRADPTQNFVASVMSYYPYEYSFSIFDRDALLRGYVDSLLIASKVNLASTPPNLLNQNLLSSIQGKVEIAEEAYSKMDYQEALSASLEARRGAAVAVRFAILTSTAAEGALKTSFVIAGLVTVILIRRLLSR